MYFTIDGVLDLMKHTNSFLNIFSGSMISLFPLFLITSQWFFFCQESEEVLENKMLNIFA